MSYPYKTMGTILVLYVLLSVGTHNWLVTSAGSFWLRNNGDCSHWGKVSGVLRHYWVIRNIFVFKKVKLRGIMHCNSSLQIAFKMCGLYLQRFQCDYH